METLPRIKAEITDRIRSLLKTNNWTQADLARHSTLPKSFITKILQSDANLSISTLSKLEDAFGCPVIQVSRTKAKKHGTEPASSGLSIIEQPERVKKIKRERVPG